MAPFIKVQAIEKLLDRCSAETKVTGVTRWRPIEIAAGVTDIEVFEAVSGRGGDLFLRQDLHAKYFRGDDEVFVGSANLTGAALGWSADPNLELLVPLERRSPIIEGFEDELLRTAVRVDQELYDTVVASKRDWAFHDEGTTAPSILEVDDVLSIDISRWLPRSRNPAALYKVYSTSGEELPTATRDAGTADLQVLHPPRSLTESAFDSAIGASLLTLPVVRSIDQLVSAPQRFGAVRDWLERELDLGREEADRAWQTLIRWMRHFLSDRYMYERPRHSEIISRRMKDSADLDPDPVWNRIMAHSGETFHQLRGKPFTYEARGRTIYLQTTNRMISRTAVERALARWPIGSVSDVHDLSAPSYLFAILTDRRICQV